MKSWNIDVIVASVGLTLLGIDLLVEYVEKWLKRLGPLSSRDRPWPTALKPLCTKVYCDAWRHEACGSGYCASHCKVWCAGHCIDPRPVPVGKPGHKPTVLKGGKS